MIILSSKTMFKQQTKQHIVSTIILLIQSCAKHAGHTKFKLLHHIKKTINTQYLFSLLTTFRFLFYNLGCFNRNHQNSVCSLIRLNQYFFNHAFIALLLIVVVTCTLYSFNVVWFVSGYHWYNLHCSFLVCIWLSIKL